MREVALPRVRVWRVGLCARACWNLGNKSVSRLSESLRETLCLGILLLPCDRIIKATKSLIYWSAQQGASPCPGSPAPLSVPEFECFCGLRRRWV